MTLTAFGQFVGAVSDSLFDEWPYCFFRQAVEEGGSMSEIRKRTVLELLLRKGSCTSFNVEERNTTFQVQIGQRLLNV